MCYPRTRLRVICGLILLLLGGCTVAPVQSITTVSEDLPKQWTHESVADGAAVAGPSFWHSYNDPALSGLIEKVLANNNDVRVAALKIKSARLSAGLAFSDRLPTPSASASGSAVYDLKDGKRGDSYGLSAGLTYEVDFWRKYAGAQEVADLEVTATVEDYYSAQLSLIGTTAELYWKISYLKDVIALQQLSCSSADQTLQITEARRQAGAVAKADVVAAAQSRLSCREELQQSRQTLSESWHALAMLTDQPPQENGLTIQDFSAVTVPVVAAGLPAGLLEQRPDLRAAELRLQKLEKQIAVTRAGYLPRFSLTGTLGSSSEHLRDILQNPLATIGADLALPFLEWRQLQLDVDQAENDYVAALVGFRDTLISALGEVEDALSARAHYLAVAGIQKENLDLARQAEQLSLARYRAGAEDLQAVLSEQDAVRTAREKMKETKLNQLNNSMTLCLALGGGDLRGAGYADRYAQN